MVETIILIAVLAVIIGGAAFNIYRAKKNGAKCIGCSCGCKGGSCKTK